jgi:hypothetical protein
MSIAGCPVDKTLPNLREISISVWNDFAMAAEAIGTVSIALPLIGIVLILLIRAGKQKEPVTL